MWTFFITQTERIILYNRGRQKMSKLTKFYPEFIVETQDLKNTTHIKNEVFDVIKTLDCLKNETSLLFYLIRNKAFPMQSDNTKHKIKENWYEQKGKIVASRSIKKMAEDLGVCNRTIRYWLTELSNNGIIKIEKEFREHVYILGEIKNNKEYYFYAGHRSDEDVKLSGELRHWTKFLRAQLNNG